MQYQGDDSYTLRAPLYKYDHERKITLHITAYHDYLQICNLLLKNNASVNQRTNKVVTALSLGAVKNMYAPCYFRTMRKSIKKIIMEYLRYGKQRKTVTLMYAPCYFRTLHKSINKMMMDNLRCG